MFDAKQAFFSICILARRNFIQWNDDEDGWINSPSVDLSLPSDRWLNYRRTVDSVICLRGATNLPTDCWFSHLSEGGDTPTDCWFSHLSEGGDKSTARLFVRRFVVPSDRWLNQQSVRRFVVPSDRWLNQQSVRRFVVPSDRWLNQQFVRRFVAQIYRRTIDSVICLREATNLPTDCWFNHPRQMIESTVRR
jgi:hypothetical protein